MSDRSKKPKPSTDQASAGRKRTPGRPFAKGHDPRRGHGLPGRSGRPADELRARLTGSFADRVAVLEDFADGAAVVRTTVPLRAVLPFVLEQLEVRGGKIVVKDESLLDAIELEARTSPSPKDRISAIEQMAKYGLGQAPQELKGKFTGKATVTVVIRREGRRITAG